MTAVKKPFQLLMLALASVAGLFVVTHWVRSTASDSGSVVEAITRERPVKNAPEASDPKSAESRDINLALPQRSRVAPDSKGEAFAKLSWLPPPPPPRIAPPPPPPAPVIPVAPPLPFTFVGLIERGSAKPQAFLSKGDVLLVVAAGDLLDNNTYRVDTLGPQQIVITYLPLNTLQTLNILGTTK
ncbi:MAG TPA: hypothetical protein PK497_00060 [Burkholderiaceae bacterium]|nr:hypothetical protein [Burkholderiaceae bacterium]HPH12817.1 hypothetical protein [Burkholderiaceae bacterium]